MSVAEVGAVCFGIVIGWVTYRTLRRTADKVGITDIASVVGAVGGGAITTTFQGDQLFGLYSIGLFVGFFSYMVVGHTLFKNSEWLGTGE